MVALSIIIPAYNEEKRIERTLVEYCEFFKQKTAFDIHVIINGCVDDTIGVVKKISKKYKQINYVDIGNVGSKGAAVNYGFKIAEGLLMLIWLQNLMLFMTWLRLLMRMKMLMG